MNTEELTQVVTAHQSAIARHEQWFAEHQQAIALHDAQIAQINAAIAANVHANEVQRERFDAEIVNLVNLISTQAESIQRLDTTLERFINTLDERFRSNGQNH